MTTIAHLSDLHLTRAFLDRRPIFENLCRAVAALDRPPDLFVVTGDLFDTCDMDPGDARAILHEMVGELGSAIKGTARILIVPGNHDVRERGFRRRKNGTALVRALRAAQIDGVRISGGEEPNLAEIVPPSFHGLHAHVVAYDSTYLPRGTFGAGGIIRREDILALGASFSDDAPLLVLMHHHLIPSPVTDLGTIRTATWIENIACGKLLPALVANADHEELTMTALGSGTALVALQRLGRPVVVLHGHKHYPAVRLLRGTFRGHADVMILAAGAAGMATPIGARVARSMMLWPSFNLLHVEGDRMTARTVAFPVDKDGREVKVERLLVDADRNSLSWTPRDVEDDLPMQGPRLASNIAFYQVEPSTRSGRSTLRARRSVMPGAACSNEYEEAVHGASGAVVTDIVGGADAGATMRCPATVRVAVGAETTYAVRDALCASQSELLAEYGLDCAPYDSVDLVNRYAADEVRVEVRGIGDARCFATITDSTTGREKPIGIERVDGAVVVQQRMCPARQVVTVYWACGG
jgi:hypothetical protein